MRKLASIRQIDEIKPIPNADAICAYRIDGWWVVDKIDRYSVGDHVVYFEIDSWIPHELAPFLSKGKEPREFNGVPGERVRTIKLRGQVSQGLILPLEDFSLPSFISLECGVDLTEHLAIQKYEKPISASIGGSARGNFPSFIPKTDQERAQNLVQNIIGWYHLNLDFEVSEKLDGSSCTIYFRDGDIGVCSRNLDLKEDEGNVFWAAAKNDALIDLLSVLKRNIALQGEVIGPKIQKNAYNLSKPTFYLFDIFDIDQNRYYTPSERNEFVKSFSVLHVPVVDKSTKLPSHDVQDLLKFAEGKSTLNKNANREGIVFKCHSDSSISFKAISNKWLLKNE